MTVFDETVLDDPEALSGRDGSRLLWSLATAGAQVRRSLDEVAEAGLALLRADAAPRAVLVAVDPGTPEVARVVSRLGSRSAPAVVWHAPELPPWAGPADALLIASLDGREPRLAELAAHGARRGLAMVVAAPEGSAVAVAAGRAPVVPVPRELHPRAARWALLMPLLLAADELALVRAPRDLVHELADALDARAAACRPDADTFVNPAKALAVAFAESLPVLVGVGPLAASAARTTAETIQSVAGRPAVAVGLPDGAARAEALLRGAGDSGGNDLFRDRVEDVPELRPRLLVIGGDGGPAGPLPGDRSAAELRLDDLAGRHAAIDLQRLADRLGVPSSSMEVPDADPLVRFASATALGDFVAAYLGLGLGAEQLQVLR